MKDENRTKSELICELKSLRRRVKKLEVAGCKRKRLESQKEAELQASKRAEEEIKNLAKFPAENPFPILRLNQDGIILYANEASQVLLRDWGTTVGGYSPKFWCDLSTEVLTSQKRRTITVRCGQLFYSFIVVPTSGAEYVNLYGEDITERKHVDEELQSSEIQYRSLTENSPDLIARFDRQYRHLYVNPAAAKAGRYSPYEYVGKTIAEVGVPEEEARKWEERIRTVFETGQIVDVEDSFETPNGSRNFHTKFVPEFALDWSIHSVQSFARDITERKQAEEQLRQAKEQYQQLVENINEIIFSLDDGGTITYVSPAISVIGGYVPAELRGRPFSDFILPEDLEIAYGGFHRVIRGELGPSQFRMLTKSGFVRWIQSSSRPIVEQGNVVGISGALTDITERKLAEQASKRTEEELRKSHEELRMLADHLQTIREEERKRLAREFHDQLGQSMTALKMDLALLLRTIADEKQDIQRKLVAEELRSMQKLVEDTIRLIWNIIAELRPQMLDDLGLVATFEWETKQFETHTCISCEFKSFSGDIQFDSKKSIALFRIYQEALTNIARHANATVVKSVLRRDGGMLVLEIKDNGKGISLNEQLRSKSLGLIGMRERAMVLGGSFEIKGIAGEGTTIIVRLPL